MKCYFSNNQALVSGIHELPKPCDEKVLVALRAIGVNRADLMHVDGSYRSTDGSNIPGIEFAGIRTDDGTKVCGLVASGAYAEYVAVHPKHLIPIPEGIDFVTAAALPEALAVAWHNFYDICDITTCRAILLHGAASGVGSVLTQIAINEGLTVYATASNVQKLKMFDGKCKTLSFYDNFDEVISASGKVDLVIDILGGSYLNKNIKSCATNATIISLANMDGRFAQIDLGSFLVKNLKMIGSTIRSKTDAQKADILQHVKHKLIPIVLQGIVKPIISKVFCFDDLKSAHSQLKSGNNVGKIVISV